jgi:hypothetical protein
MNVDCHVLEVLEAWKVGCDGSKRWCFWEIGLSELTCESFQPFTDIFKEGKMELLSHNLEGFTGSNMLLFGGENLAYS